MRGVYLIFSSLILSLNLIGCGAYWSQPVTSKNARVGEITSSGLKLKKLPKPSEQVVAGVYNFRDQTGQYKNIETGSSFSTAISQGGTTILIKSLEDSGWFTIVERENLGNLLNERNIINTTREQYAKAGVTDQNPLPPLLFAGIILEGGVVSYDTNIITGGSGARYFGVGGSVQYREDRITVYLRAVSTTNGKVLKTVYVSKTILSQAVSANLFKYVNFQRLLEVETGYTVNEPVQLAMKDAIEKAVESIIIEGIDDGLWKTKDGQMMDNYLVAQYKREKAQDEQTLLHGRKQTFRSTKNELALSAGLTYLDGDLKDKKTGYSLKLDYTRRLSNAWALSFSGNPMRLASGKSFKNQLYSIDANLRYTLLPNDQLTPYAYGGIGMLGDYFMLPNRAGQDKFYFKMQYGLGLNVNLSERLALFGYAEHHLAFTDELEGVKSGKRDDFYYTAGLGLKFYF